MLIIIGLTIIIWVLWSRFIRMRLPKDIPFNLTEFWFYIILYVCFMYLIIIISLLNPREVHPLVTKFIKIAFTPLVLVDEAIKRNKFIKNPYNSLIAKIIKRFNTLTVNDMLLIQIAYTIIPRAFLGILLCFDTFFMHKLLLIYDFILIGLFSLIHRYIKYSLKYVKEQYIKSLSETYEDVIIFAVKSQNSLDCEPLEIDYDKMIYHNQTVTLEKYVDIQIKAILGPYQDLFEYTGDPLAKEVIYQQYAMKKYGDSAADLIQEDRDVLYKQFYDVMPTILTLGISLEIYSNLSNIPKIRYVKALIFSLYFTCWTYILIISFHKVLEFPITNKIIDWLILYIVKIDPFSGIFL